MLDNEQVERVFEISLSKTEIHQNYLQETDKTKTVDLTLIKKTFIIPETLSSHFSYFCLLTEGRQLNCFLFLFVFYNHLIL